MKPTLEHAGPLLVPVDETGCAVGRPQTSDDLQGLAEDAARAEDLRHALERLAREAQMFRDYGHGREHLTNALIDAKRVLDGGAL